MFGTSNPFGGNQSVGSTLSPFGGGQSTTAPSVFGTQPATTAGPFGTNPQSQTTFGFGTAQPTAGPFGSNTNTTGPFGAQQSTTNTGGGFGSFAAPASSLGGTGFGSLSTTPATNPFGSTNPSTSVFGAKPLGTGFAGTPSGTNAFTASNTSVFGANNSMTMGSGFRSTSTPSTSSFGSASTTTSTPGAFGQNNPSTSVFGNTMGMGTTGFGSASTTPASTGLFGSTSATPGTNVFGQSNPSASVFGGSSTTMSTGFGSTSTGPSTGLFGAATTSQQSGTSALPYQQTSKQDAGTTVSMLSITAMPQYENKSVEELRFEDYSAGNRGTQGQQQQPVSSFGGFGSVQSNPSTSMFGSNTLGTGFSSAGSNTFAPSNPSTSIFGAPAAAPAPSLSSGLFGSSQTTNTFGTASNQPTSIFGAPAAPQTAASSGGGIFGNTQGTNAFGTSNPTTSLFGGNTKPLGSSFASTSTNAFAPSNPTPSIFGAPASTAAPSFSGFGLAPAASATAGTSTGGLFGTPSSSAGGNLFGSSTAPTAQGSSFFGTSTTSSTTAPSAGGLFGTPSSSTGGLFGTAPKPASSSFLGGNLFGTPNANAGVGTGGFPSAAVSTPTNTAFPSSTSGGLFGTAFSPSGTSSGGLFGTATTIPTTPSTAPTGSIPPTADALLAQQLAAVEVQKKELALLEAWRGASTTGSRAVVAYAQPDRSAALRPSLLSDFRPSLSIPFTSPPPSQSTVKVRPRGFTRTESPSPRPTLEHGTIGNSTPPMLSPNAYLGLSSKTLVIKSKLTPKPMMKLNLSNDESSNKKTAAQLEDAGNDSFRRQSRRSPESVDGSSQNGHEYVHQVINKQNGNSEKYAFHSPNMSAIEKSSESVIESTSVKHSDKRTDASYDFYQKVITSPLPGGSSLLSPTTIAHEVTKSLVPKLTKKGYTVSPSLEVLANMSEGDLAAVSEFLVSREGYGSVAWEGAVDVRGIDLDSVVDIDVQTVAVYNLEEKKGTKPPVGSKLNRPAIITILNVYPKEGTDASTDSKLKFERKIARLTKKADAELISYDIVSGVWRFRVFHFSRYGLFDDESDDEGNMETTISKDRLVLRSFNSEKLSDCREYEEKAITRFSIPSCLEDDLSDNERDSPMLYSEEASLKEVNEDSSLLAAQDAYKLLQMEEVSYKYERFLGTKEMKRTLVHRKFEDEGHRAMDFFLPIKSFKYFVPFSHHSSICEKVAQRSGLMQGSSSKAEFGLRMGKSFRVGWRPDGSLVHPNIVNQSIFISTLRPCFSARDGNRAHTTATMKTLSTHLNHSSRQLRHGLFSLPESSEHCFAVALRSLVENVSYEKEGTQDVVALALTLLLIIAQWDSVDRERKLHAMISWFRQASSFRVTDRNSSVKTPTRNDDILQTIYATVCNNDACKAQSLAHRNVYLQLSALIANSSLQASFDIKEQRDLWYKTGALTFIPPALSSLYALRSGDAALEKDIMEYGKNFSSDPRSWRRYMGMLIFRNENHDEYNGESPISWLLSTYKQALNKEKVPLPIAWYEKPRAGHDKELCLLYKLLMLITNENICLVDVINPQGHTHHNHDYLNSFFLASAISAIQDLPCVTAEEGLLICDNLAAQLINIGLWEWAVYVYLYHFGHETLSLLKRREKAKDIVLRFLDGSSVTKQFFLHHDLGIPDSWLEESLAYRRQYHENTHELTEKATYELEATKQIE